MMITRRLLTGCTAVVLLAAGSAQAQLYFRVDGAYSKSMRADFKDNDPTMGIISGNASGTAQGQFDDFGNGTAVSVGAGTRFSPIGRVDVTLGYRKYRLDQSDKLNPPTQFKADVTSFSLMYNLYFEFSEGRGGVAPYIGVGAGVSQNRLGDLSVDNPGLLSQGTVSGENKVSPAYGFMFGFGFPIGGKLVLDIAYRYMDLGDVQTKQDLMINGVSFVYTGASGHVRAQELAVGLRF